MIVVTGAAGFIASVMISKLNSEGFNHIIAVDNFAGSNRKDNLKDKKIKAFVERDQFFDWLPKQAAKVEFIVHLGARTDTAEQNQMIFDTLNLNYSKTIWKACIDYHIPLIYASSAATYGNLPIGEASVDNENTLDALKPMNPYGESKHHFDQWVMEQTERPFYWAGFKFFNVYGPNEYHKGRMASVIFHAFNQIKKSGSMKLFRSHREDVEHGHQSRDFVYVKDVVEVLWYFMKNRKHNGLYNLGTGTARTFLDLTKATFSAMNKQEDISYIDTPEDIRDTYQYFTEANMEKVRAVGYDKPFTSLEDGVKDYITNYLLEGKRI
jgi:ADP-L-glycero-D-manno-heptose 6-epimerase